MIISFIGGLKNFPSHLMHCNIASLKVHKVIFSKHGTKKKKRKETLKNSESQFIVNECKIDERSSSQSLSQIANDILHIFSNNIVKKTSRFIKLINNKFLIFRNTRQNKRIEQDKSIYGVSFLSRSSFIHVFPHSNDLEITRRFQGLNNIDEFHANFSERLFTD